MSFFAGTGEQVDSRRPDCRRTVFALAQLSPGVEVFALDSKPREVTGADYGKLDVLL